MKLLAGAFGAVILYSPADALVPERMRQWEKETLLEIRHPFKVEGDRLTAIVRDYKAWAEVHQGRIGDMTGFLRSRPERFAMMEDTNPSQIRHQVRHYGESRDGETTAPFIDAALFLSLAQEFDTQQYAMEREMDAVQALERRMMQQISGITAEVEDPVPPAGNPLIFHRDYALFPQMIPQRVRAWSLLALNDGNLPWLYVTRSRPVVEHLMEQFAQWQIVYDQPLLSGENVPVIPSRRMREMLEGFLIDSAEPSIEAPTGDGEPAQSSCPRLILYRLTDLPPRGFLETLGGRGAPVQHSNPPAGAPKHTLLGLLSTDAASEDPVRGVTKGI